MRRQPTSGRTILVIDDQAETLISLRMLLEREGHRVLTADTGQTALALAAQETVQLVLVDYFMPEMSGEETITRIRERDSVVQIVLHTGYAGEKPPRDMLRRLAIQGYHDKSDGPDRLLLWVDVALKAYDQLHALHLAERLKTELLASVSHEFRTPLNIIVGYLDLLHDGTFGACPPDATDAFAKIRASAGYLLELVEEFLDLSQLEAGALRLRHDQLVLPPLLHELGESFSLLVRTKPVEFIADVPADLPTVEADGAKFKVIVQNLLSNAAKFTDEGIIRLTAGVEDGRVVIAVSDTGPGIPLEQQEAIFDVFHQLEPHDGDHKGVGLGLALARRFARMMGGELTLTSAPGAGATFRLMLPVTAARRGRVPQEAAA